MKTSQMSGQRLLRDKQMRSGAEHGLFTGDDGCCRTWLGMNATRCLFANVSGLSRIDGMACWVAEKYVRKAELSGTVTGSKRVKQGMEPSVRDQ